MNLFTLINLGTCLTKKVAGWPAACSLKKAKGVVDLNLLALIN